MTTNSKFDDLLAQLGTGKWNFMFFVAIGYWNMHLAPAILSLPFLAPQVDHTCLPPDNGYTVTSYTVDSHGNNITSTDNCNYLANSTSDGGGGFSQVACTAWLYDNSTFTSTLTSQFNLVCSSEYLRATYSSMYMFGTLIGAPINGCLSDRFGRKTMLTVGVLVFFSLSIGACWIPVFSGILGVRFILGLMHPAIMQSGYILALEVTEPKHRSVVGIVLSLPWALSTMAWGGVAYLIREWQWLQLAVSLPALLLLPALWFLDESPRWLIVNGHFERALEVLRRAARWNNTSLPPTQDLTLLMRAIQKESTIAKEAARGEPSEDQGCQQTTCHCFLRRLTLFRTPKLRLLTLVLSFNFFMVSATFYGMSLNAVNYSADPFVYMVVGGLVEVPGYTVMAPIVARLGRKWPNIVCYFVSGTVIMALAFIPPGTMWLVMTLAMVGKMCISAAYQILYLYTMELFPTEVRLQGLGFATIASRVGSIFSPFITDYLGPVYPSAPSLTFGLSAILAGLSMLPLRETLGVKLPDTISDLEDPQPQRYDRSDNSTSEAEMAKLRA
ncbi:organic cation transporter protein isoform X2 [Procambarus clarkii]|nr:organic cation transporter protein-like isoform X2 [Procambarus clarkii]XP_045598535.1 organic cation transporter protein-like isoform X2 [Procambarus clarkii]